MLAEIDMESPFEDIRKSLIEQFYNNIEIVLKAAISVGCMPVLRYSTNEIKCTIICGMTQEIIEFKL